MKHEPHAAIFMQKKRFHLDTAVLMQVLQITRQGLIGVCKSLEQVGLLAVEQDDVVYPAVGWSSFAACSGRSTTSNSRPAQ